MNVDLTVIDDIVVGITYELHLEDSDLIDAAGADDPLLYMQGHGNIISGLETALSGLKVGDSKDVVINATDAYGEVDMDSFVLIPLDAFPADLELEEGMALYLGDDQSDEQSDEPVEAYVYEIRDDGVVMDMNHPLAGETLYFSVQVVSLRQAMAEEIAHGHVHEAEHSH